ncbi:hypothetical protein [Spirulina subsalsa]|nr:hypothetical protein [Spirulina subsalsa]
MEKQAGVFSLPERDREASRLAIPAKRPALRESRKQSLILFPSFLATQQE